VGVPDDGVGRGCCEGADLRASQRQGAGKMDQEVAVVNRGRDILLYKNFLLSLEILKTGPHMMN
jgi:hypothetical protein